MESTTTGKSLWDKIEQQSFEQIRTAM
ncbi:uncharacterized protein METZ01_LOCUS392247, partial [marine metagenome]